MAHAHLILVLIGWTLGGRKPAKSPLLSLGIGGTRLRSRDSKASAKRVTDTDHSCGVSRWVID